MAVDVKSLACDNISLKDLCCLLYNCICVNFSLLNVLTLQRCQYA